MRERRRWRRWRTRQRRREKTYAFYRAIAPDAVKDARRPWPRLALIQGPDQVNLDQLGEWFGKVRRGEW